MRRMREQGDNPTIQLLQVKILRVNSVGDGQAIKVDNLHLGLDMWLVSG